MKVTMEMICEKLKSDNGKCLKYGVFDDGFDRVVFTRNNEIVINGHTVYNKAYHEMIWNEYMKLKERKSKRTVPGVKANGFTLIELMVLIVILGILASIAIPAFIAKSDQVYNPMERACPNGLATAVTPQGEEILVCRKNPTIQPKQTVSFGD
ncbi:hypothetical protein UGMREWDR_CDS0164 [Aeromonas phage GomatiRiver_11]|nr:hypothetical protein OBDJBBDK_00155 [Aeromonas phage AhFM11]WKW84331.1 hypothetical protein UGMREWDR_CDS0164 [Aeromonas phage GomatiRiver_11]